MNDFLSWEFLGTFAGAATFVTLMTQVAKQFINVDPKWISLAFSMIVSLGMVSLKDEWTAAAVVMALLNALFVTGAAVGLYEAGKDVGQFVRKGDD